MHIGLRLKYRLFFVTF